MMNIQPFSHLGEEFDDELVPTHTHKLKSDDDTLKGFSSPTHPQKMCVCVF